MTNSTETLSMLIRFFNMQSGASCRTSNTGNLQAMDDALTYLNGDITALKNHIREWTKENPKAATEIPSCLQVCLSSIEKKQEEPKGMAPQTSAPTEAQVSNSLGILEQALVKVVAETSAEKIENAIMGQVKDTIRNFIKDEYGSIERKITTIIDGKQVKVEGVQHEKFDTVLKFVANDEPVFLTGPAGSGKNFLCKQVADALDLKFYFTNAVTQEYKLTGFTDASALVRMRILKGITLERTLRANTAM